MNMPAVRGGGDILELQGRPLHFIAMAGLALALAVFLGWDPLQMRHRNWWLGASVFGVIGCLVGAWRMPRGTLVRIDVRGIEDNRLETGLIAWEDLERIVLLRINGVPSLCLWVRDHYRLPSPAAAAVSATTGHGHVQISLFGLHPDASTVLDYVRRMRPDGRARSSVVG